MGGVHARLREATRAAHARMEARVALDEVRDIDAYRALLIRLCGFWRSWQPAIGAFQPAEWYAPRRRLALLEDDLARLGLSAAVLAALPGSPAPALRGAAEALGALYVLEGSTLGGRIILRRVEPWLGAGGGRYFAGYGERTGAMWREFLARLDASPETDLPAVTAGALAAFAALEDWIAISGR